MVKDGEVSKGTSVKKWVAGVLASTAAAVLAGLILWWVTYSKPPPPPKPEKPEPVLSLLERVSGNYELMTWHGKDVADSPQMTPTQGTLRIDQNGNAYWEMQLHDGDMLGVHTCSGTVDITSKQIEVGDAQNNFPKGLPKDLLAQDAATGRKLISFLDSLNKAFGGKKYGFSFDLDESSDQTILQWRNHMGLLNWRSETPN